MMFLVKKGNKENVVGQNEIQYLAKDGWIVKNTLIGCPYSVKSMRCDSRSPTDIKKWYQHKIDEIKLKLTKYENELKRFKEMIDSDE